MRDLIRFVWDYVVKILWGWAGIVLAVIAVVDLIERAFDRKITVSTRHKVALALAVLFFAQFLAYKNLSFEIDRGRPSPELKIYYGGTELNGQIIPIKIDQDGVFRFAFQVKNEGRSSTQSFKVRLFFATEVEDRSAFWELSTPSSESTYPWEFFWGDPFIKSISAGELWKVPEFSGKFGKGAPTEVRARIKVFYDQPIPAEAAFTIRVLRATN